LSGFGTNRKGSARGEVGTFRRYRAVLLPLRPVAPTSGLARKAGSHWDGADISSPYEARRPEDRGAHVLLANEELP